MQNGIPVRVLGVRIGPLGQHQPVALLLSQTGGEGQGILPPIHVPLVIRLRVDVDPLVVHTVAPRGLLVFGAHEVPETPLLELDAGLQEELDHGRVLVDDGDVQHVLACGVSHLKLVWRRRSVWGTVVFVRHVNVVDELRVEAEEALGDVGVERRGV